jgi:hypothetical protein
MIKIIYILWFQGFDNAPYVVKQCVKSWKRNNPDWTIILLDDTNLNLYIDLEKISYSKNIKYCHLSDIIRMLLLEKYGGLWVDATSFCHKPLNDWLPEYSITGFFAFDKPYINIVVSNWFLYSEKEHYIIREWCKETLHYYKINGFAHDYYIHHVLFEQLCQKEEFKHEWDKVSKLSGTIPHSLNILDFFKTDNTCHSFLYAPTQTIFSPNSSDPINTTFSPILPTEIKKDIDSKRVPVYKLSYKCDFPPMDRSMNLYYLIV